MKALIIDDHKINRLYLKTILEENFPVFKKIDETSTVSAAVSSLENVSYDLIFLDMELKDGMGFDVLKDIKDFIYVIVVTSHKEYAIQAIKHNVSDYILKPINLSEFKTSIHRVVKLFEKETAFKKNISITAPPTPKIHPEDTLLINFKNQYVALDKKEILYIKAQGKYSEIHSSNRRRYTSYKNLKEFDTALTDSFVRIHHSYLVNIKHILSYSRDTAHVTLSNGEEIPVSVRKRDELFKKFKVF